MAKTRAYENCILALLGMNVLSIDGELDVLGDDRKLAGWRAVRRNENKLGGGQSTSLMGLTALGWIRLIVYLWLA